MEGDDADACPVKSPVCLPPALCSAPSRQQLVSQYSSVRSLQRTPLSLYRCGQRLCSHRRILSLPRLAKLGWQLRRPFFRFQILASDGLPAGSALGWTQRVPTPQGACRGSRRANAGQGSDGADLKREGEGPESWEDPFLRGVEGQMWGIKLGWDPFLLMVQSQGRCLHCSYTVIPSRVCWVGQFGLQLQGAQPIWHFLFETARRHFLTWKDLQFGGAFGQAERAPRSASQGKWISTSLWAISNSARPSLCHIEPSGGQTDPQ